MSLRAKRSQVGEQRSFPSLSMQQYLMQTAGSTGGPSVASTDEALRDAATWACLSVKAKSIATLPVDEVRIEGKRRVPVPSDPVVANPGVGVSRRIWLHQLAMSLFTDGNAFGQVVAVSALQRPSSIALFDPSCVKDRRVVDGVKQVSVNGVVYREYPHGDLWHMAGEVVMPGSPFGLSPIQYGAKTTGTSLAAERFGGQFFSDGGMPTWMLAPETDPGEDGAKAIKAKFQAAISGNREPIVVPKSLNAQQLTANPSDAAFIDLMQFEVQQACRRHGVPPSMVYAAISGQNVTYSNVTQADLAFLKHTLSYPITLIEDAWSDLIAKPRVVKLNRDAILRGDPESRWKIHDLRLKNRTTSIDEVRALEDEEPYGGEFAVPGIPGLPSTEPPMGGDA